MIVCIGFLACASVFKESINGGLRSDIIKGTKTGA